MHFDTLLKASAPDKQPINHFPSLPAFRFINLAIGK